jgi:hypothetical protein
MMAEDYRALAERRLGRNNAAVAGVVLQRLEMVKRKCRIRHD